MNCSRLAGEVSESVSHPRGPFDFGPFSTSSCKLHRKCVIEFSDDIRPGS